MVLEAEEVVVVAGNGSTAAAPHVVFTSGKPWLAVEPPKANDAVEFYKAAFGAEEVSRVAHAKRKAEQDLPLIRAAELKIGSFIFVVSDFIEGSALLKSAMNGSVFTLQTDDVETAVDKAVAAGAVLDGGEADEAERACFGGRTAFVKDPYGNVWVIASPFQPCPDVAA
ncbi:hypothetical protein ACP275_04G074200 [Erythranthe tilingii]